MLSTWYTAPTFAHAERSTGLLLESRSFTQRTFMGDSWGVGVDAPVVFANYVAEKRFLKSSSYARNLASRAFGSRSSVKLVW